MKHVPTSHNVSFNVDFVHPIAIKSHPLYTDLK